MCLTPYHSVLGKDMTKRFTNRQDTILELPSDCYMEGNWSIVSFREKMNELPYKDKL